MDMNTEHFPVGRLRDQEWFTGVDCAAEVEVEDAGKTYRYIILQARPRFTFPRADGGDPVRGLHLISLGRYFQSFPEVRIYERDTEVTSVVGACSVVVWLTGFSSSGTWSSTPFDVEVGRESQSMEFEGIDGIQRRECDKPTIDDLAVLPHVPRYLPRWYSKQQQVPTSYGYGYLLVPPSPVFLLIATFSKT
ncbi:hypothetical protein LZ30DRAFT_685704 [Colletotrichum cereale]|nr:hypothetical protein LZ30DRAFT_685704 [Colletotrichum cereale]